MLIEPALTSTKQVLDFVATHEIVLRVVEHRQQNVKVGEQLTERSLLAERDSCIRALAPFRKLLIQGMRLCVNLIPEWLKQFAEETEPAKDTAVEDDEDDEEKGDADDEELEEEIHASSRQICDAAFAIEEKGELAVAQDRAENACYVVRFDDVILPDPADFETQRTFIESGLVRDRRQEYLAEWRRDVLWEADPTATIQTIEQPAPEA